ncbi:MAG: DUF6588 family protein [Fodinibius sp.]|nr:DUF6588 family protein [Fodinibius sp.]
MYLNDSRPAAIFLSTPSLSADLFQKFLIGDLRPRQPGWPRDSATGINQYLSNATIPLNLAVVVGYNYLVGKRNFDLQPQPNALPDPGYFGNYSNQQLRVQFNTVSLKVVGSKKLNSIQFYGALGLESTTMNVDITGDYPIPVNGVAGPQTQTITDPISYRQRG